MVTTVVTWNYEGSHFDSLFVSLKNSPYSRSWLLCLWVFWRYIERYYYTYYESWKYTRAHDARAEVLVVQSTCVRLLGVIYMGVLAPMKIELENYLSSAGNLSIFSKKLIYLQPKWSVNREMVHFFPILRWKETLSMSKLVKLILNIFFYLKIF